MARDLGLERRETVWFLSTMKKEKEVFKVRKDLNV